MLRHRECGQAIGELGLQKTPITAGSLSSALILRISCLHFVVVIYS
jgi:hypothetical protein